MTATPICTMRRWSIFCDKQHLHVWPWLHHLLHGATADWSSRPMSWQASKFAMADLGFNCTSLLDRA